MNPLEDMRFREWKERTEDVYPGRYKGFWSGSDEYTVVDTVNAPHIARVYDMPGMKFNHLYVCTPNFNNIDLMPYEGDGKTYLY